MSHQDVLLPALGAVVGLGSAVAVLRPAVRRPTSWPAALMLASAAWWSWCQVVERSTTDAGVRRAMEVAHLPATGLIVYGAIWFVALFTGNRWNRRWARALAVEPALVLVLALTSPWHTLLVGPNGERGLPTFWANALYCHAVMAVCFGLLALALEQAMRDRPTTLLALGAAMLPMATSISVLARIDEPVADLTPVAFVVTALMWLWADRGGWGFSSRQPIAVDQVVESLADGLIVIDQSEVVLVANRAARRVLEAHGVAGPVRGRYWREIVPEDVQSVARSGGLLRTGAQWYDVRLAPVLANGARVGTAVQLRDVTEFEQVRRELADQAVSDALTGLRNRRFFLERGQGIVDQARAGGQGVVAAMVDIDHFKLVNDTFGHPAGDRVLARVAAQVQRRARLGDAQVRFGGEEFLLLMIGETLDGALARMEDLRRACAELRVPTADGEITITVSIGVFALAPDGDVEDLLRRADVALYRAKDEGRNRVCTP